MRRLLILVFLALAFLQVNAQKERKIIRGGNTLYDAKKYEKATTEYLKAKDIKANSFEAKFNLGDAMFKQKKYEDALGMYQNLTKTEKDRNRLGALYHNIGNSFLAMKKIDEGIAAYEESLRNNPVSNETKYNLAYARMLKDQQQKQNKQNQNQNNKDQNKDQKNKDQKDKQDNKDKQNQDQKDKQDQEDKQNQKDKKDQDKQNSDKQEKGKQNNNDKKEEGEQGEKTKISKEDAKRLLDALGADEKKVQEKVQKAKAKAQKSKEMKVQKKW